MSFFGSIGNAISGLFSGVTGGGLLSAGASLLGGLTANQSNQDIASRQMEFQQQMSNTSYQRAVKDMQAAGLNPMLAYSQGGASTPSGATATMQDVATPAVNSALSATKNQAEVANLRETNNNIKSQTALNTSLAVKAQADANLSSATAAKTIAGQPEAETFGDLFKTIRSYTQPASAAASNHETGVVDRIKKFIQNMVPADSKARSNPYFPK